MKARHLTIFPIAVVIGVLVVYFQSFQSTSDDWQAAIVSEDEGQELQVPLETTEQARSELMAEIKARTSYSLRDIYEKYLDRVGANGIIHTLHEINPTCHDEGHDLGKLIYARLGTVGGALRTCRDACYSGCMHGVMMEIFAEEETDNLHVDLEEIKAKVKTICEAEATLEDYKYGDCVHGVGHALMFLSDYEVSDALERCELFDSGPEKYYCATGAFMEYMGKNDKADVGTKSKYYPCDENRYSAACFRYKSTHVVRRQYSSGLSLKDLINDCLAMKGGHRLGCFHGLGNAHSVYIAFNKISISDVCGQGSDDDKYMCIEGAIERIVKYVPHLAEETCNDLQGWQAELCEQGRQNGMYNLDKPFELYLP